MARPAEKARAMLNKWVALREKGNTPGGGGSDRRQPQRRPHLASDCEHLADAERFRGQIVREISLGIAQIQNPALPEHEIRDLNDAINRKLREKWHWNKRILELGGLDYNAIERQRQIEQQQPGGGGGDVWVGSGYRYFGVAKTLPGVAEYLAKEEERVTKQSLLSSQRERHKHLTPDYFGWRDEEDGVLLEVEALASWQQQQEQQQRQRNDNDGDDNDHSKRHAATKRPRQAIAADDENNEKAAGSSTTMLVGAAMEYLANIPANPDEMAHRRLQVKKALLLEQYGL
ncbi:hypothetical protein ACA910_015130 [Epithemia clementina (nom. ined.)]